METCTNHPDRETSFRCSKHGFYLCEDCLACRDPNIYCKFRSACPIWYEHKRRERLKRKEAEKEAFGASGECFSTDDSAAAEEACRTQAEADSAAMR